MSGDVPEGVGLTALGMAWVRLAESGRADRLFEDPYAGAFVAAAPDALPIARGPAGGEVAEYGDAALAFVAHAVIRTRFYDDWVCAAAASGIGQFVLLAAGLDTRAFRLDWPAGARVFEADLPELFAFKERVLGEAGAVPRCVRTVVAADLREDWPGALAAAGFDPVRATGWLVEGLFTYLTPEESVRLLENAHRLSARGSGIAFEHAPVGDAAREEALARPEMARFAAMWRGGIRTDPLAWLAEHGWAARLHDADEVAEGLGRPNRVPANGGFVTASRAET